MQPLSVIVGLLTRLILSEVRRVVPAGTGCVKCDRPRLGLCSSCTSFYSPNDTVLQGR